MEGKVCSKCGVWKSLEEFNKKKTGKYGRRPECRECQKEYGKQHYQNNKEHYKEYNKQHYQNNKEHKKEYYQNNKEHKKEYNKQHYQNNKEHIKEHQKQYRKNNKEYYKEQRKEYYQNNKEYIKEQSKQYYQNNKENNLQYISSVVEQINPLFKQLNLPVCGYIYMFKNTKTDHIYIGQTIQPLKVRYKGGIVKGWINNRKSFKNQKFKEELNEEDIQVTEVLDVAFCQYHLDKLEAYYIDKYDSYNNGYNNNAGHHDTDDGLEEFMEILQRYNLEFVDGQILKKAN